jgi:hypothetical protein
MINNPGNCPRSLTQLSWAGKTPLDNQSGTRTGRAKSKKGNRYLAAITGETAAAVSKTQTREGARYRRLARRRGKAKALVAIGNTQLNVYHKLLSSPGMRYEDLGADYYERRRGIHRQISHHVGKLGALGFEVTLCCRPEPHPDEAGDHPRRLTDTATRRPRQVRTSRGPLPHAQLRSYFRVSNFNHDQPRTVADNGGHHAQGQACDDPGSLPGYLASGRRSRRLKAEAVHRQSAATRPALPVGQCHVRALTDWPAAITRSGWGRGCLPSR